MSTWIKIGAVAIAAAALFFGGYRFAAALYQADIDAMKADHALALVDKEKENRANERKQADALAKAWDELEKARADAVDLSSDLERVRKLVDDYRARLSAASTDSCDAHKERLARCVGLVREGAELSAEGADLSQRVAARKDAVVKLLPGSKP